MTAHTRVIHYRHHTQPLANTALPPDVLLRCRCNERQPNVSAHRDSYERQPQGREAIAHEATTHPPQERRHQHKCSAAEKSTLSLLVTAECIPGGIFPKIHLQAVGLVNNAFVDNCPPDKIHLAQEQHYHATTRLYLALTLPGQ